MNEAEIAHLCQEIQTGWNAQYYLARKRQQDIASATERLDKAFIEGMGQHHMSLDPYVFHNWGQRLGYQCWRDPEFVRQFKRDNPEVKITIPRRRNTVGYGD